MEIVEKKNKVAIIVGLCAAYFLGCFTKLSPSAVMPQIQQELGLSSGATGFISSLFFASYAIMQFFVGPLCRKFSAPKVLGVGAVVAAVGLYLFANGTTVAMLATGRFLIGLGASPCFIGVVYYFQQCYTGKAYVQAYGYSIVVSNVGSAVASAPLKALLKVVPRNTVFMVIAVSSLVVGVYLLVLALVSDERGERSISESVLSQIRDSFVYMFRSPVLRIVVYLWFVQSAMLMSYQGLWCIKWTDVAFPGHEVLTSFPGLAVSLGVILSGKFAERWRLHGPLVRSSSSWKDTFYAGGWLCVVAITLTTLSKILPNAVVSVIVSLCADVLYGYAGGNIILQGGALIREQSEPSMNAGIVGVCNGLGCFMQQLSQWITGAAVDLFGTVAVMNLAFGYTYLSIVAIVVALVLYSRHILKRA